MFSRLAFSQVADTRRIIFFIHTRSINEVNASLAILSSCSSGYGKSRRRRHSKSCQGFAYAGCPSILMTLWEVADKSTSRLWKDFIST